MKEKEKELFNECVEGLNKLDYFSLILIKSNAEVLLNYQNIVENQQSNQNKAEL